MARLDGELNQGCPAAGGQPSRRVFLRTATAIGVSAAVGGLWGIGPSQAVGAMTAGKSRNRHRPRWQLEAVRVEQAFADGTVLPLFRFQAMGHTPTNGALPLLTAKEGSFARLKIHNHLDFPIQPLLVGLEQGPVIKPGGVGWMTFQVPPAGTWLLTEALLGPAAGPVGFGAMLVSYPRHDKPVLSTNIPRRYDREYMFLYQNIDDRWNLDLDAGLEPDTSIYEPNFHTVNGLCYPQTTEDPDTTIMCMVGEHVLIRMGNLGHVRHTIHHHGYHVELVARNNIPETMLPAKDTNPLPGYTTADVILPVAQPGMYGFHPHSLTAVTANGFYPYGQIAAVMAM